MSKKNNNLSDVEFSAIQYSLLVNGGLYSASGRTESNLCAYYNIFCVSGFVGGNKSNEGSLFVYEHLIIQNIVSIFDTELYIATKEE